MSYRCDEGVGVCLGVGVGVGLGVREGALSVMMRGILDFSIENACIWITIKYLCQIMSTIIK